MTLSATAGRSPSRAAATARSPSTPPAARSVRSARRSAPRTRSCGSPACTSSPTTCSARRPDGRGRRRLGDRRPTSPGCDNLTAAHVRGRRRDVRDPRRRRAARQGDHGSHHRRIRRRCTPIVEIVWDRAGRAGPAAGPGDQLRSRRSDRLGDGPVVHVVGSGARDGGPPRRTLASPVACCRGASSTSTSSCRATGRSSRSRPTTAPATRCGADVSARRLTSVGATAVRSATTPSPASNGPTRSPAARRSGRRRATAASPSPRGAAPARSRDHATGRRAMPASSILAGLVEARPARSASAVKRARAASKIETSSPVASTASADRRSASSGRPPASGSRRGAVTSRRPTRRGRSPRTGRAPPSRHATAALELARAGQQAARAAARRRPLPTGAPTPAARGWRRASSGRASSQTALVDEDLADVGVGGRGVDRRCRRARRRRANAGTARACRPSGPRSTPGCRGCSPGRPDRRGRRPPRTAPATAAPSRRRRGGPASWPPTRSRCSPGPVPTGVGDLGSRPSPARRAQTPARACPAVAGAGPRRRALRPGRRASGSAPSSARRAAPRATVDDAQRDGYEPARSWVWARRSRSRPVPTGSSREQFGGAVVGVEGARQQPGAVAQLAELHPQVVSLVGDDRGQPTTCLERPLELQCGVGVGVRPPRPVGGPSRVLPGALRVAGLPEVVRQHVGVGVAVLGDAFERLGGQAVDAHAACGTTCPRR